MLKVGGAVKAWENDREGRVRGYFADKKAYYQRPIPLLQDWYNVL